MERERSIKDRQTPPALLARAPLEEVLPHGQISRHAAGEVIIAGDQLSDWVFCVLSGRCEEHRCPPGGEISVHHAFERGQTFGAPSDEPSESRGAIIVASEDSVLLRIRCDDLRRIESSRIADDQSPWLLNGRCDLETSSRANGELASDPARGKLMTLAMLSPDLPVTWLGEHIAKSLRAETGDSVVLLRLVAPDATISGQREAVDWTLGGVESGLPDLPRAEGGFDRLRVEIPRDLQEGGALAHLLDSLTRRFDYVLAEIGAQSFPVSTVFECVARSASAYLFVRPAEEDVRSLDSLLRELRPRLNSHVPVRLKSILCLADGEPLRDFDRRLEQTGLPIHFSIRGCPKPNGLREGSENARPTGTIDADVRRLARDISDRLIGLALSSGGAKGFAHIGVIQVLEENGIEVDIVSGASMGAYIGALWASGSDGAALEKLAREMEARWAMLSLVDPIFPPRRGFVRGYALKHRLMRTIGRAHFAELPRPLRVVAANLNTQERTVFSSGEVASSVHASTAVPGICVPVPLAEDAYVDGGIVDPLPVDVLQEMGVRTIFAVNTIPTPERLRYWLQQVGRARAQQIAGRRPVWWRKLFPIEQHVNYFAPGNILEILMRSVHGAQSRAAENACRRASFVLRPDICDDRWLDLRHPGKYIAAGRAVTQRHLDEIKALLARKGEHHELETTPESLVAAA